MADLVNLTPVRPPAGESTETQRAIRLLNRNQQLLADALNQLMGTASVIGAETLTHYLTLTDVDGGTRKVGVVT